MEKERAQQFMSYTTLTIIAVLLAVNLLLLHQRVSLCLASERIQVSFVNRLQVEASVTLSHDALSSTAAGLLWQLQALVLHAHAQWKCRAHIPIHNAVRTPNTCTCKMLHQGLELFLDDDAIQKH